MVALLSESKPLLASYNGTLCSPGRLNSRSVSAISFNLAERKLSRIDFSFMVHLAFLMGWRFLCPIRH